MTLNNNKKEQKQILESMEDLGFSYNWNELEEMEDRFDEEQIIIEGDSMTLFLEVMDNKIISVDYLPFPERETYWRASDFGGAE